MSDEELIECFCRVHDDAIPRQIGDELVQVIAPGIDARKLF